ncbi:uncharacterized protein LOC122331588 isoform X1 [Puntigrus tetrazona]|uniref:uncharacterized protein LOC122331588 isoform X1 n=1 Tax=Puntigrus tetrazona TaxID=1606681 RepID=UPI001C88ECF7|nr:uncharacterized protein LOC122331588 isoform X1 [Puntigrus tetrazona]
MDKKMSDKMNLGEKTEEGSPESICVPVRSKNSMGLPEPLVLCSNLLANILWIIYMFIIAVLVVYFCVTVLMRDRDWKGWLCMIIFHKILWMSTIYIDVNKDLDLTLSVKKVFHVFGSVVVVLLSAVTLMTELIVNAVNGERAVGDLRVVVFSSESIFTFFLLIFIMFGPWFSNLKCLQCCQNASKTLDDESVQRKVESHEINSLLKNGDPEAGRSDVTEETQPQT